MIHRFCISHEKPLLPESWYDDCISLGEFQTDSVSHVSHLDRFWHEARPMSYGTAGTHVLPIAIERFASDVKLVEICNYRKKVLPSPEGVESEIYSGLRELRFGDFDGKADSAAFMPRADLGFLVAHPIYFENSVVEKQLELRHFDRRDLGDYASLAIEAGVLDENSASEFLGAKHFIPGGCELGIFPKSWLVRQLSGIEVVGKEFLSRYGNRIAKYDEVQIRAISFLAECLGSFLLIRHLMEKYSNNIPADIFGYVTVIRDSNLRLSQGIKRVDRLRK